VKRSLRQVNYSSAGSLTRHFFLVDRLALDTKASFAREIDIEVESYREENAPAMWSSCDDQDAEVRR
jgi:hypothetical protein